MTGTAANYAEVKVADFFGLEHARDIGQAALAKQQGKAYVFVGDSQGGYLFADLNYDRVVDFALDLSRTRDMSYSDII